MAVEPDDVKNALEGKSIEELRERLKQIKAQITEITNEYRRDLEQLLKPQAYAGGTTMSLDELRNNLHTRYINDKDNLSQEREDIREEIEKRQTVEIKRQADALAAAKSAAPESKRAAEKQVRNEGTRDQGVQVQVGAPGEAGSPVKGAQDDKPGVQAPDTEKKEDDELARVRREKEKLSADVSALTAELNALKSTLAEALAKNKEQDVALLDANKHIAQLVEDTRLGFEKMKQKHEEEIRIKEISISAMEGRITALQEEMRGLKEEHKTAIDDLNATIKALEQERDRFKRELGTAQEALRRLTAENDKNKTELESAQRTVTALQTETTGLKATNAVLTNQVGKLDDQVKERERQITDIKDENGKLSGANDKLKEEIARLRDKFDQFQREAKIAYVAIEAQLKAMQAAHAGFAKLRADLEQQIKDQADQIRTLQQANQALQAEKNALNDRATRAEQLIRMGRGGVGPGGRKLH